MEKLIDSLENLKEELDNTECIKNIRKLNNEIDEDLLGLINKYRESGDITLKSEIINIPKFIQYKKNEGEVNFIILEINKRLKTISKGRSCVK